MTVPAAGEIFAGKYRIERVLGQGGMGIVVAARHVHLEDRVALKFLLPEVAGHPEVIARFLREARAAVRIRSEHVARVTDVGTLDSGLPYMVMEYLEGTDVSALIEQRGGLPVADAVEYVLQASEAIAEAHSLGIVHRDLKPANLFLITRPDGTPSIKVLDFGISKVTDSRMSGSDAQMTKTSAVMGSPLYMSPEQMTSSRDVDARADIWALGIILYELLSGTQPFVADTMPQLCGLILTRPPTSLRDRRPDVPHGLEAVLLRCLEKDPARRYSNVAELAIALLEYAPRRARGSGERISRIIGTAGLSQGVLPVPPAVSDAPPPPEPLEHLVGTAGAWSQTGSRARTSSLRTVIVAGVGALVLAIGVGVAVRRASAPHEDAPSAAAAGEPKSVAEAAPAETTTPVVAPAVAPVEPASGTTTAPVAVPAAPAPASRAPAAATPVAAAARTAPPPKASTGAARRKKAPADEPPKAAAPPQKRPGGLFDDLE